MIFPFDSFQAWSYDDLAGGGPSEKDEVLVEGVPFGGFLTCNTYRASASGARFTVPPGGSGGYAISMTAQSYTDNPNRIGPITSVVSVLHNGQSVYASSVTDYPINTSSTASLTTNMTLLAGDTLDFLYGPGHSWPVQIEAVVEGVSSATNLPPTNAAIYNLAADFFGTNAPTRAGFGPTDGNR